MADIQWFYAKSKVPVCLAISDTFYFLDKLKDANFLTEEEALELQGDARTAHRVVYECLCWIEDKDISSQKFFAFLFQKSLLNKFPDLKPIHAEYIAGKYRYGIHSTADEDKDPLIFAQEKVQICLTITDRFPFLHGLQDLTILSESESLKLQADERTVSRVIYESLSLIEKKDMKLNIVFEYIFQPCYLKLYPGLQDILQEPSAEFLAPFNGGQYPIFSVASDLLDVFEHNKMYICEAVSTRFPFLHGLHDRGLLSHIQLLGLQASQKSNKEVLYEALCHITNISDTENFFAYLFQEFYLKLFPQLHTILQCLNAALSLDICLPSTAINGNGTRGHLEQGSKEHSSGITKTPEQNSSEQSPGSDKSLPSLDRSCRRRSVRVSDLPALDLEVKSKEKCKVSGDPLPTPVRKCRMGPINYSEPPDLDWDNKRKKDTAHESRKRHKSGKEKAQETNMNVPKDNSVGLKEKTALAQAQESRKNHVSEEKKAKETNINVLRESSVAIKDRTALVPGIKHVTVRVEFPKQVFNDKFKVRCGDKTGTFKKARWKGHPGKDRCIRSGGKKFTVMAFEKYGGKGRSKSWKKTIQCEEIRLGILIKAGILKRPIWDKQLNGVRKKKKTRKNDASSTNRKRKEAKIQNAPRKK